MPVKIINYHQHMYGMGIEKMPIDQSDRVRSGIIKLSKKKNVDPYMFDFIRTRSYDTRLDDLFEVIEEIKNSYVVDIMYGNFNRAFLKAVIVIIFTNEDISKFSNYLSLGRWEAFSIYHANNKLAYIDLYDQNYRVPFE